MSGNTYEAMLRELGEIPYKRMMYGEWLRDECEECHTTEQVTKFVDVSGKIKDPIYLCDKCFYAGLGPKHLREWLPEDKE